MSVLPLQPENTSIQAVLTESLRTGPALDLPSIPGAGGQDSGLEDLGQLPRGLQLARVGLRKELLRGPVLLPPGHQRLFRASKAAADSTYRGGALWS